MVAYLEKNPQFEKTVYFIHGNSGSCRTWRKQFCYEFFNSYRLIAFDLPAHGQSSASDNPTHDYSPITTGQIIATAIKNLANDNSYALVGFSYGTNVIAEALNHNLKPAGIVLNASCVIGQDYGLEKVFKPAATNIFFQDTNSEEEVKKYFSEIFMLPDKVNSQIYSEDFLAVRQPFRSTLLQSVIEGKASDEIASLKKCDIPLQLFFGLEDNMLNIDYLDSAPLIFWRDTINKLPQAGHFLQTDQPAMFNELLAEYLGECFKAGHVS